MKWIRVLAQWMMVTLLAVTGVAHAANQNDYVLGAGDVIRVTVFQNPDLTLEARVSEGGAISYPLLGAVKLGGLTVGAAEKKLADGLREGNFLKQPQVSILVMQVKGNQVSVLGVVNRPGRYPLELGTSRLSDILAVAGGVVPLQGADTVVVTGVRNGKPFRRVVDLPMVFASAGSPDDFQLENNDVVWVDRAPLVYIYGEVQRPGSLRLERDMTVLQVLAAAGGLNQRGTERGIKVHRRDASGQVQVLQPDMNDKLQANDVVYVKESLF